MTLRYRCRFADLILLCKPLVSGPATEYEQKLRIMIEQSSNNINNALKDIITAEEKARYPLVTVEYKPLPIKEAFVKILETNKEILVEMFQEVIKDNVPKTIGGQWQAVKPPWGRL